MTSSGAGLPSRLPSARSTKRHVIVSHPTSYPLLGSFNLIHKYDFPEGKFSLYFLATLPEVCLYGAAPRLPGL